MGNFFTKYITTPIALGNFFTTYITTPIADFVSGFITNVTDSSFYIPSNIFSQNGVAEKYNLVKDITKTFSIISLLVCLVMLLYSMDIFSTAKLRRMINEFMFSIFIIQFGDYAINQFNLLSNYFVKLFLPSVDTTGFATAIFAALGVASGTGVLETLGLFIIVLIGFVALLLLLMMLTHSIALGLIQISIILYPLFMAFYPLNFGKSVVKSLIAMYGGLLALGPLQALVFSLLTSSLGQVSQPSFGNIMKALGMILLAVFAVPGVTIYVITRASNPKIN